MSYHVWRFMAFKPTDQSYGHINGIVCSNDLISCTRALWNDKQCCLRKFSFSLHEKIIFHFSSAQNEVFLWRTYHIFVAKLDQINFLKYKDIFNAQLTKWLGVKSFDPPLVKKTNSCRFSWKRVKFELQLPHSLLFIFSKNLSRYISIYLIRETPKKFQDSTTK